MHPIGKVIGVEVYRSDVVVVRQGHPTQKEGPSRGDITEFSKESRRRLAFVACNTTVAFRTMVTLTYPREYPTDGERVKTHLRRFLKWLRRDTGGCDYLWFLEFQKRGAPHIHILIDYPMPATRVAERAFRHRVAMSWYRFVGSGDAKHLAAGTRTERLRSPEGGAHYAVKYAQKMQQKAVPAGYRRCGRFWGHTKRVKPVPIETRRCTEDDVRGALEGWKYARDDDFPVYHTLYNVADRFASSGCSELDNRTGPMYTCAERKKQAAPSKQEKESDTWASSI